MSDEQRSHARVAVNKEFESVDELVAEYVTNISKGGVFIRSKKPLPVGTEVDLSFSIYGEDIELIEGVGRIVRVDKTSGKSGMGVVFTRLTPKSEAKINVLIAAATPKG